MGFIINPYRFAAAYDADYQAVLDRGTALGYTLPSVAQRTKQNQYVLDLKAASVWTLLDVLYVFATDGDSDFATINWKAPSSYQASKVNSPTFTSNQGFTGNGSTSYLNTNWTPSTNGVNFTQNDAGVGCWENTNVSSDTGADFGTGTNSTTGRVGHFGRNASGNVTYVLNTSASVFSGGSVATSIGFKHILRTNSTTESIYINGSFVDSNTSSTNGISNRNMVILAQIFGGSPTQFSTRQISMFFAGASLSGSESNLYTAWNNYFTSL